MAYQVSYDYKNIKVERIRKISAIGYALAVLGLVVLLLCAQFSGSMLDFLLMNDRETVQDAAGEMLERIRNGQKVEHAIDAFCRELAG